MIYQIIMYVAIFLTMVLISAHIADLIELRKFREELLPGSKVLIKLDDVWTVATVTKIYYNGSLVDSVCDLYLFVDEIETPLFKVPITDCFNPKKYKL